MTDSEKLDLLIGKVSNIEEDVSGLKEDVSGLKEDVSGLKEDVSGLKEDVSSLKEDVSWLKEDVSGLKKKVTNIEVIIENEVRTNIKRIAEGHLDLSRKLNEVLKKDGEKELLSIRVNILETELNKIKERID